MAGQVDHGRHSEAHDHGCYVVQVVHTSEVPGHVDLDKRDHQVVQAQGLDAREATDWLEYTRVDQGAAGRCESESAPSERNVSTVPDEAAESHEATVHAFQEEQVQEWRWQSLIKLKSILKLLFFSNLFVVVFILFFSQILYNKSQIIFKRTIEVFIVEHFSPKRSNRLL